MDKKEVSREIVNDQVLIHWDDGTTSFIYLVEPPSDIKVDADHEPEKNTGHVFKQ